MSHNPDRLLSDLDAAIEFMDTYDLTMVFVKRERVIYKTGAKGLAGYLEALRDSRTELGGCALADRVVGRAHALLSVYANLGAVFGEVMSRDAAAALERNRIPFSYGTRVASILNRDHTGPCPFERAIRGIEDPSTAYQKLVEAFQRRRGAHDSQGADS